jgi:restriction system protein
VKRVGQKISAEILRAFMELIGEEDVGLYVSTAGFTKDAEDYARTRDKIKIHPNRLRAIGRSLDQV